MKIKILIVEHDIHDIELLENELKSGGVKYEAEIVENEKDYTHALINFMPDIILADFYLPTFDGTTAFDIKEKLAPDTPFIFVSGTIGEEKSIEFIKNGVTDYALKDRLFTLNPKVKRALKEAASRHQRKLSEEQKKIDALKLEEQNKELVKTNSELDRFVYSTTHDLRSPLTSILGLVNLIERETKETNTLLYSNMIKTSIHRLDEFIKNILGYSQNNRTNIKVEKIPVQKTTEETIGLLRNITGSEGIHIEVSINEQQPFYSDLARFRTILENLISNAIKYHKKDVSGRYIKVTGKSDSEHLHLCIEDNGIGIEAEYHEKIFDMFFRLPSTTAGTGFGLYVVKETIEKLHGSLKLHSEVGVGTTFSICIRNLLVGQCI